MTRNTILCLVASALATTACDRPEPSRANDVGQVVLSITNAPADAACLRVTAKGATTAIRSFGLTTGLSTSFALNGLPVGPVVFTAEAFPIACGLTDVMSVASYVSDAVSVTLLENVAVNVPLALHRAGRANVAVDFPGAGSPNGAACTSANQCGSGFCVDGVCCNSGCAGTCQSCNLLGSAGTCTPISSGQDPQNECAADPVASCGRDGFCNGAGGCRLFPAGTECAAGSCTGSTEVSAGICSGSGMCLAGATLSCGPFACAGVACGTSCAMDAHCAAGFVCRSGSCIPSGSCNPACPGGSICQNGACVPTGGCMSDTQCAMGLVCRNGSCIPSGSCNPACPGGSICQNGTCVPTGGCMSDTQCGMGFVCRNGSCIPSGSCNPACPGGSICQNGTCVPTGGCMSDTQCGMGFVCRNGSCIPTGSCNPACPGGSVCQNGACVPPNTCNPACAPGFTCQNGACVPPPPSGPALLWRFDETTGTIAVDSSSNHLDGTYVGSPASSTLVPLGAMTDPRSRAFLRANQQAVRLAGIPATLEPSNNLTLSAWYRATSVDTSGAELISAGDNYVLRLRPNQVEFAKRVTVNGAGAFVQCLATVSNHLDGAWHHLSAVSTAAGMTVFFDGLQVCSNTSGQDLRYDRGPDFWVGRHGNGSTAWDFEGNVDDVRVYTRALTPAELAGLTPGGP
jgi:Cys-rich repeat protein